MPECLINPLPEGWEATTLGELCAAGGGDVQTGPFGSQLHASDYVAAGVPSVMPVNIGDNRILTHGIARVSEQDAERLGRHRLRAGDIVYSRRGDVGRRALVRAREDGWLCGTGCLRVRSGPRIVSAWLSYYLGHPEVRAWIVRHAVGATMPNLNTGILSALPVAVPPPSAQAAIAEVLGSLDDKIENNLRIQTTSRALVSAWLADALQREASQDRLTEVRLGDIAEVNVREVTPGSGSLRYLEISAVGDGTHDQPAVMRWAEAPGRARRGVADRDVLWSTVRPNRRSHCMILDPAADLVVSTGFAVLTPRTVGPSFLYGITDRSEFIDYLISVAEGSAYPAVLAERFLEARVPLLPQDVLDVYEEHTMLLHRRAEAAARESRRLAVLRDALLPRLLSGDLRVREAVALVGEAV